MLAHRLEKEGVMVAERIGRSQDRDDTTILCLRGLSILNPEIAWVGKNEQQLKTEGVEVNVRRVSPFAANGRAVAANDAGGRSGDCLIAKTGPRTWVFQ